MKRYFIRTVACFAALICTRWASGADQFVLRAPADSISAVADRHGLTILKSVNGGNTWVVAPSGSRSAGQILRELSTELGVQAAEPDATISVPEVNGGADLGQSTAAILDGLSGGGFIQYYGSTVWSAYVNQTASNLIRLADAQNLPATGFGTVAIIDTGVDPSNRVLQGSLVPGYDFVHDTAGTASEWSDLDAATAAALSASVPALPSQSVLVRVSQSTAAILDQSTAAILDVTKLPAAFGHGTMVAGIIHLVAPTAKIMPLKAFAADGTARMSDIIRAIYYAADNGASVINMSFSTSSPSISLVQAINYAIKRGVICVASTGNDGMETLVYPAGLHGVIGVASTDNNNSLSLFSNYGPVLAIVAAPGEQVVTVFPGGGYAVASGTSFAAPFVSGGVALMLQVDQTPGQAETFQALCSGRNEVLADTGCGHLNLIQSVRSLTEHQ